MICHNFLLWCEYFRAKLWIYLNQWAFYHLFSRKTNSTFSRFLLNKQKISKQMFRSSHFSFLVTFCNEVTKIQKNYVIFVYILQGKMGKIKKWKENHAIKSIKIPKTKRLKYGMNETKEASKTLFSLLKILWKKILIPFSWKMWWSVPEM